MIPSPTDPVSAFHAGLAGLGQRHPRIVGLWLLRLGVIVLLVGCCTGVALANIGFFIAAGGALIAGAPLLRLPGSRIGLVFAGWVGLSAVAAVLSGRSDVPIRGYGLLYTWIAGPLAQVALAHAATRRWALTAFAVACVASSLLAVAQYVLGWRAEAPLHFDPTATGHRWFHGSGFFGVHLTQGFVMSLGVVALASTGLLWGSAAAAVALLVSQARGSFVGMAIAVGAALVSRGGRALWAGSLAAIVVLLTAGAFLQATQPGKLQAALRGEDGRWPIWRTSLAIAAEQPVLGAGGPEAYKERYVSLYPTVVPGHASEFAEGSPHAHNSFLSLVAKNGIPALLLYLCLWAVLLRAAWQPNGAARSLAAGALGTAVGSGMFEDLAGHAVPSYALFVLLGLAIALARDARGRSPQAG